MADHDEARAAFWANEAAVAELATAERARWGETWVSVEGPVRFATCPDLQAVTAYWPVRVEDADVVMVDTGTRLRRYDRVPWGTTPVRVAEVVARPARLVV